MITTADELRRGVNDDVSAPLERSHEIRRREGRVDDERYAVTMSDFRYLLNIDDIRVRVAERLDENRLRVVLYRSLERALNIRVRESRGYPGRKREGVREKIVSAAVDGL